MKTLQIFLCICFCSALLAGSAAPDVSGHWVGTVVVNDKGSGSEVSTPVEFQLEQRGDVITGKVGRKDDSDASPIKSGKISGDQVTLDVVSSEIVGPAKFILRVLGEAMEGDMTVRIEEGPFSGKVKLTRKK